MADETPEILLVEDSADDVEFFSHTLERTGLGVRLHTIPDGAAALEFLFPEAGSPSRRSLARLKLIILDLKLPKISGTEVLRRLKSEPSTRTIPVVILSSSQVDRDLLESYELGANSYIVKPMEFDAFATSVRMLCQYWLQFNRTS
jgi:CheY-like chemotaxis protein